METNNYRERGGIFVVAFLVLALVMGSLGSLITMTALGGSATARQFFGIDDDTSTKQEKIILEESSAFVDAVAEVSPAVVSILTTRNIRDFFGNVLEEKGGGTGFVIYSDGMILTNKHVVSDADAQYTVVTTDGKDYDAKILAVDPVFDLAVLKIEATGLPVVTLGDSDELAIGQWVLAIGNALGEFQNTVTAGVVSAVDRQVTAGDNATGIERLEGLIQTDAAINPGNSGGPLVNIKGQVVGINTAIAGDAQNIGFAIPVNAIKTAIDSVRKTGTIVRPLLGVRALTITKEIAELEGLSVDHGALIVRGSSASALAVIADSPADKAGLKEGDIILAVNDEEITESQSLSRLIQKYNVGDEITVKILRSEGEEDIKVILDQAQS